MMTRIKNLLHGTKTLNPTTTSNFLDIFDENDKKKPINLTTPQKEMQMSKGNDNAVYYDNSIRDS